MRKYKSTKSFMKSTSRKWHSEAFSVEKEIIEGKEYIHILGYADESNEQQTISEPTKLFVLMSKFKSPIKSIWDVIEEDIHSQTVYGGEPVQNITEFGEIPVFKMRTDEVVGFLTNLEPNIQCLICEEN